MSLAGTLFLQQQWFVGTLQLLSYCGQRCQLGGQSMYLYVQVPRLFPQQTSDGFGEGGALVVTGGGGGSLVVPRITTTTTASTTACKVSFSRATPAISEAYIAFVTWIQTTSTLRTRQVSLSSEAVYVACSCSSSSLSLIRTTSSLPYAPLDLYFAYWPLWPWASIVISVRRVVGVVLPDGWFARSRLGHDMLSYLRAVFKWLSKSRSQIHYFNQSQQEQTAQ